MRKSRRFVLLGLAMSLFVAVSPAAQADTARVRSEPNGHLSITSSSGSSTDKDKDGDFNTLTQADRLSLFYAVWNLTDQSQTVHITVTIDGPGTARDATLVDEDVFLETPGTGWNDRQGKFEFQIKRKDWPEGSYSLSVTGSGSESATATSSFTVAY